jgi:ribosomal protein S18 acetylase RimI-like enzyme
MYMLATRPNYHRKGLATRLLRHGLDIVDKDGKKAYIEATAHGFPLYQRFGFKEIDRKTIELEPWGGAPGAQAINYCMMREPGASGEKE